MQCYFRPLKKACCCPFRGEIFKTLILYIVRCEHYKSLAYCLSAIKKGGLRGLLCIIIIPAYVSGELSKAHDSCVIGFYLNTLLFYVFALRRKDGVLHRGQNYICVYPNQLSKYM